MMSQSYDLLSDFLNKIFIGKSGLVPQQVKTVYWKAEKVAPFCFYLCSCYNSLQYFYSLSLTVEINIYQTIYLILQLLVFPLKTRVWVKWDLAIIRYLNIYILSQKQQLYKQNNLFLNLHQIHSLTFYLFEATI